MLGTAEENLKNKILNNKRVMRTAELEGNAKEYDKAKKHLDKNLEKLQELKESNNKHTKVVLLKDKVEQLENKRKKLMFIYSEKFGSNDGSVECEQMLDEIRDLETTLRVLKK